RWEARTRLHIVSLEKPLVSEVYGYGGTPDALFRFQDGNDVCEVSMGDWKTATGIYPDNLLQLAAYMLLCEENFPDQPLRGAHIVRFSKDFSDVEHRSFEDLTVEKRQFLRLREAFDDDKLIEARV